jgi:hypothetical protein
MSDLRTRIAKAIAGAVYGHNTLETSWDDLHEDAQDEYFAEADAVIRELKRSDCGGDLCKCSQCRITWRQPMSDLRKAAGMPTKRKTQQARDSE